MALRAQKVLHMHLQNSQSTISSGGVHSLQRNAVQMNSLESYYEEGFRGGKASKDRDSSKMKLHNDWARKAFRLEKGDYRAKAEAEYKRGYKDGFGQRPFKPFARSKRGKVPQEIHASMKKFAVANWAEQQFNIIQQQIIKGTEQALRLADKMGVDRDTYSSGEYEQWGSDPKVVKIVKDMRNMVTKWPVLKKNLWAALTGTTTYLWNKPPYRPYDVLNLQEEFKALRWKDIQKLTKSVGNLAIDRDVAVLQQAAFWLAEMGYSNTVKHAYGWMKMPPADYGIP